jgi:hypothetical protein
MWYLTLDLPLVSDWIGAAPERLCDQKIYSIDSSLPFIVGLREKMSRAQVGMVGFTWIVPGLSGSECALISLRGGRVEKIRFYFPDIRYPQVKELLPGFTLGPSAGGLNVYYTYELIRNGFSVRALVSAALRGVHYTPNAYYSTVIDITTDDMDWYLGTHDIKPTIASAIRDGSIVTAMTLDDVREATHFQLSPSALSENGDGEFQWQLPLTKDHPAPMTFEVDFHGGMVVGTRTWQTGQ